MWTARTAAASKPDLIFAVASLVLGTGVIALSIHIEREIYRLQRIFPGFHDRWKWRRRMCMALVIASGLLVLWRWL